MSARSHWSSRIRKNVFFRIDTVHQLHVHAYSRKFTRKQRTRARKRCRGTLYACTRKRARDYEFFFEDTRRTNTHTHTRILLTYHHTRFISLISTYTKKSSFLSLFPLFVFLFFPFFNYFFHMPLVNKPP